MIKYENMFRPSGSLEWSLSCSNARQWHFLGAINSESRSFEAAKALCRLGVMVGNHILRVRWPASPYSDEGERRTNQNMETYRKNCGQPNVLERNLLAPVPDFKMDALQPSTSAVILDITSMPKRFYFYYLKCLIQNPNVDDLLVTYCAGQYGQGALTSNHEDWDVLPTFRCKNMSVEEKARKRLAVNVGFMPGGLEEHLMTDETETDLSLILPFPARVSSVRRVWKSAMEIRKMWHGPSSSVHVCRVAPDDISGAFDLICRIANGNPLSLAPFGPKPISAAMCIFATLTDSPVYYAQPKWYNPDYTTGPDTNDSGEPKVSGHWIKHRGKLLYNCPGH